MNRATYLWLYYWSLIQIKKRIPENKTKQMEEKKNVWNRKSDYVCYCSVYFLIANLHYVEDFIKIMTIFLFFATNTSILDFCTTFSFFCFKCQPKQSAIKLLIQINLCFIERKKRENFLFRFRSGNVQTLWFAQICCWNSKFH